MTDLNVKLSVQIPGGSTIQSSRIVTVGAHRKIDFSLPPGNGSEAGMKISFLPEKPEAGNSNSETQKSSSETQKSSSETQKSNSEAGKINLLLIQSSFYSGEKEGGEIRFSIGDKVKEKKLTEPLLLLGSEMIDELAPPQTITFFNTYPTSKPISEKDKEGKETQKTKITDVTTENTAQITILIGLIAPDTTPSAAPTPAPSPA